MRLGSGVIPLALACFVSVGACGLAPQTPKTRLAVVEFRGPSARLAREATAEAARGRMVQLVDEDEYDDAARSLRATRMRKKDVAKVAGELGLDAVIHGRMVKRKRNRYRLSLRVRDGASGKLAYKDSITLHKKKGEWTETSRTKLEASVERAMAAIDERVAKREPKPKHWRQDRRSRRTLAREDRGEPAPEPKAEPKKTKGKKPLKGDRPVVRASKSKKADKSKARDDARSSRKASLAAARAPAPRPSGKPAAAKDEVQLEPGFRYDDRVDANGQVLDDEVPDVLK